MDLCQADREYLVNVSEGGFTAYQPPDGFPEGLVAKLDGPLSGWYQLTERGQKIAEGVAVQRAMSKDNHG